MKKDVLAGLVNFKRSGYFKEMGSGKEFWVVVEVRTHKKKNTRHCSCSRSLSFIVSFGFCACASSRKCNYSHQSVFARLGNCKRNRSFWFIMSSISLILINCDWLPKLNLQPQCFGSEDLISPIKCFKVFLNQWQNILF